MYKPSECWYRKLLYNAGIVFFLATVMVSCNKNDMVGLGQDEVLSTDVTDTVTVNTSTMLLDSLPTAGKGVMLVGNVADPELGTLTSKSYFQILGSGVSSTALPEDAKFDSVRLKLKYNGYYYGDTTVTQELSVHQLQERLTPVEPGPFQEPEEQNVFSGSATFYNRTSFKYNDAVLAKKTFKPKPASKDSLMIRLPDELGSSLFNLVENNDALLSNTENFLDYFKGLVLVPGKNTGNAIIGYTDTAEVKLYYSYEGNDGLRKKAELKFSLYDNSYQFNSITSDKSNTPVKNISLTNPFIPASESSGKTYIQGGIGLVTKIEIPYIPYLSGAENVTINKAELEIEVPNGYDKPFAQPSQLVLLVANKNNKPVQVLTDPTSGQSALYLTGPYNGFGRSTYSFMLTGYIGNYIKNYSNTSLILSLPVADLQNSVNRVVLGSPGNGSANIKLRITYTKLNL